MSATLCARTSSWHSRHVVHGARSARRHRLLLPGYRGERCLAAAHARPLIRPEDTLLQAVCAAGTSRSVRRDAIQRDALLARPDAGRQSDDRGLRYSSGPNRPDKGSPSRSPPPSTSRRTVVRLISDRALGPTATVHPRRTHVGHEHACSDIFISFRHRTFSESKPVTFVFLTSCRHAYNVNNI